jgi:hypothetical protein
MKTNKDTPLNDLFSALSRDMYKDYDKYNAAFQPLWIRSSEIKRFKVYWYNPFSIIRYFRTKRHVMKIAVDINKSMPSANPYPGLTETTYNSKDGDKHA